MKIKLFFQKIGRKIKYIAQIVVSGIKKFLHKIALLSKRLAKKAWNSTKVFVKTLPQSTLLTTIISISIGLLISLILMIVMGGFRNAFNGFGTLVTSGAQKLGNVLFKAAPIILLGLSVGIGFKAGLFNIGTPGQYLMGGFVAVIVANLFPASGVPVLQLIVCMLSAVVAGMVWAVIPGILKALFNVSEVIACIMLNYIAVFFTYGLIFTLPFYDAQKTSVSTNFSKYGKIPRLSSGNSFLDIGIIIAVLVAIVLFVIMAKTKLGYKIKAIGSNKDGAKYSGINSKVMIIITMAIAGALVGLASSLSYLAISPEPIRPETTLNTGPFDGIFVALIANSNPIGTIFAGFFISYLRQGTTLLQFSGFSKHIADVIVGIIIYLVSIQAFIKNLFSRNIHSEHLHSELGEKNA
jgi:simple sugar transport system permease protein